MTQFYQNIDPSQNHPRSEFDLLAGLLGKI